MSGSIDTRIVQMQFQNSEFEKGIKESLKSLEMFKKATEFKDTIKSFDELQKLGNSFSLAKMSEGIDAVSKRFSTMGIIGMQVLENLTNKAINYGEQMVKSLSIDQITAGWGKYEQKTKAVQQITNATGLSIEEVNKQLDKLTWFSDETSYSFTDMVSNIGKFTSMNIPLDKSVTAMQGISTWAALSGAGVQEASRAMFNLSQAIGLGAVKMQDWKSIALANMATAEFKQTAIDTAIAMGKLKKGAVDVNKFESSLSKGWFTSDVLIAVLEKYGSAASEVYKIAEEKNIPAAQAMALLGDKFDSLGMKAFRAAQEAKTFTEAIEATKDAVSSGWMTTFEMLFGNYEEAKTLWTDLANGLWEIFAAGSEARNAVLQEWHDGGGRETFFEGIYDICYALLGIIHVVREALSDIFPPVTVERLNSISEKIKTFGSNMKDALFWVEITRTNIEHLKEGADKLLNPIKEFTKEFKIGTKGKEDVKEIQQRLEDLGFTLDRFGVDGIFGKETEAAVKKFQKEMGLAETGVVDLETWNKLFASDEPGISKNVETYRQFATILTDIGRVAKGVFAIFHIGWTVIKGILNTAGYILKLLTPLFSALLSVAAAVGDIFVGFDKLFTAGDGPLGKFSEKIQNFFAPIGPWAEKAGKDIRTFFGLTDNAPDELITLPKLWNNIKESIKNTGVIDKVKNSFDKLKNSFKKIKAPMKKYWEQLKESFGKKSQELLSSIPQSISNVISWIGDFLSKGIDKLSAWIETIPEKIEKVKSFFKALTMEGDPAANKKPGFLLRVKNALQDVWKWIFGGTGENGEKQKGALQRILNLVTGDIEGALDGLDETKKQEILGKLDGIKQFFKSIREGIYLAVFGESNNEEGEESSLSSETIAKITEWRAGVVAFFDNVIAEFKAVYDAAYALITGDTTKIFATGEDGERSEVSKKAEEYYNNIAHTIQRILALFKGEQSDSLPKLDDSEFAALTTWREGIVNFLREVGKTFASIGLAAYALIFGPGIFFNNEGKEDSPIYQKAEKIYGGIMSIVNGIALLFTGKTTTGTHGTDDYLSPKTYVTIWWWHKKVEGIFTWVSNAFQGVWLAADALIHGDAEKLKDAENSEVYKIAHDIYYGVSKVIQLISAMFTGKENENLPKLDESVSSAITNWRDNAILFFEPVKEAFSAVSIAASVFSSKDLSVFENTDGDGTDTEVYKKAESIYYGVSKFVQAILQLFTGNQNDSLPQLDEGVESVINTWRDRVINFFTPIVEAVRAIGVAIRVFTTSDTSVFEGNSEDGKDSELYKKAEKIYYGVSSFVQAILQLFTGNQNANLPQLDEGAEGVINTWRDRVINFFTPITEAVQAIGIAIKAFKDHDDSVFENAGEDGTNSEIYKKAKGIYDTVNKFIEAFNILFKGESSKSSNLDSNTVATLWQWRSSIIAIFDTLKAAFEAVCSAISSALLSVYSFIQDVISGEYTPESVSQVIGDFFASISNFFNNIYTKFRENVSEETQKRLDGIAKFWNTRIKPGLDTISKFVKDHWLLVLIGVGVMKLGKAAGGLLDSFGSIASLLTGNHKAESLADKILKFGIAIAAIAASIYVLGALMTPEQLQAGIDNVEKILWIFAGFFGFDKASNIGQMLLDKWSSSKWGNGSGSDGKSSGIASAIEAIGNTLKSIAEALLSVAIAILIAGAIPSGIFDTGFERITDILVRLGEFIGALMLEAGIISWLSKGNGKTALSFEGLGFDGLASLILACAGIIELFKGAPTESDEKAINKGIDVLDHILTKVGLLLGILMGESGAGNVFTAWRGGNAKTSVEFSGLWGVAALIGVCAVIIEACKNMTVDQFTTGIAVIEKITEFIEILAGELAVISVFKRGGFGGIAGMFLSISALVSIIAIAVYALDKSDVSTEMVKQFGETVSTITAVISILSELIGQLDSGNSLFGIGGNDAKWNALKGASGIITAVGGIVAEIGLALWGLHAIGITPAEMDSFGKMVSLIGGVLAPLSEAAGQLESGKGVDGKSNWAAAKGGASLGAGISALIGIPGAIVGIVGGINELIAANTETDLVSVFESGAKIFASIGSAIGGFINELSNGTAPGGWLILLMGAAIAVGQMPDSKKAIEGAAILAAAFDVIVGVIGLLSGIAGSIDSATDGKLTEWLENGAETFKLVGKSIMSFFTGFGEAIADYKSYKNTLQAKDQITFAEAAGAIRDKIGDLSKIEGLDEDLNKAMEIAETLNRFFGERNPIAYSANFSQVAGYRTEPEAISTDIKKFVAAIVAVKEGLTGISEHYHRLSVDTYSAIGIAEILYNYFTAMEQYPIDVTFAGDTITNAELLSKDIKSFGESIGVFRSAIEGMASDQSSITSGANVAIEVARTVSTFLGELEDTGLDDKGRVKNSFTSTGSSISDVVFDRLESLGKSMQRYSQTFSGLSNSQISEGTEKAVSALRSVAGLLAELGENDFGEKIQNGWIYFDAIDDFFTNTDKHTAGGRNFATTLSEFAAQLEANDVDLPSIATLLDSYATFAKLLSGQGDVQINTDNFLGDLDVASVVTRLSQFTTDLGIALSENAGTIEGYANNFNQAGNVLAEQFTGGESISGANRAGKDMGIEAAKGARTKYGSMKSAGNYLGLGLVKGIMERLDDAFAAGEELARKAKEGTETEGQIYSPSKVFMKLGGYLSEGLAIGIRNESNLAYKAAGDLANGLAGSTGGVLSSLSSILASDIDDTPVIRPVVDLSGARLAAGSVNSMFGDQEFAVKSRMLAGQAVNGRTGRPNVNQNGSGSVVAAVNGMNDKIGALGEAINGMQLIMDGKALVGHITTLMDKSLGRMTNVRRRLG